MSIVPYGIIRRPYPIVALADDEIDDFSAKVWLRHEALVIRKQVQTPSCERLAYFGCACEHVRIKEIYTKVLSELTFRCVVQDDARKPDETGDVVS